MNNNDKHFDKVYWFIVGLCVFGAILTIFLIMYLPKAESTRIADTALIFWLSTAVSGGIGYLLGSNASMIKKPADTPPGTTTADITATIQTTAQADQPKNE